MIDLFLVYSFIKRLAIPFNKWEAFSRGIIDDKGNILKKRRDLVTIKDQQAFGTFDLMVLKIKKLLEKVPGGNTRLGSYAAALWLVRENIDIEKGIEDEDVCILQLQEYMVQADIERRLQQLKEESTNSVGGGNIAGIIPNESPPVFKKKPRLHRRNNNMGED